MERLRVSGIAYNDEQVKFGLGPKHETSLMDFGGNVLIFRPVENYINAAPGRVISLEPQNQIERRIDAYNINRRHLPNYTSENNFIILQGDQGEVEEEEKAIRVPVFGRITKKLENVTPITEIDDKEIVGNENLCEALAEINLQFLKILFEKGIIIETGGEGNFGKGWSGPLFPIIRKLTHDNVMIGSEEDGKEKIFIDPDWYNIPGEDGHNPNIQKAKRAAILAARVIFFKTLSLSKRLAKFSKDLLKN